MHSFVALDLELTPFSGDQQRIIEIAAARFSGPQVVESFSTLVDPRCDLSSRVEALTGICRDQLDAAPSVEATIPRLLAFVGEDPLVGQSIEHDLRPLAAHGVRFHNRVYDTHDLAMLMLPGLPAHDLGTIAAFLDIPREQKHRALDDAIAAGRVFAALVDLTTQLDIQILAEINALASHIRGWPFADLFRMAQKERLRDHFSSQRHQTSVPSPRGFVPRGAAPAGQSLQPSDRHIPVGREELRSLLHAPEGAVASSLDGFEEREEQLRMMDAVAEALNEGEHLLVEAGTGTGKSMAYLIPAIYHAVRNGRPVVVSTNTINLQDQLYQKDLPMLRRCLPVRFEAALLKGRANYLCLRRWQVLSRAPNLTASEAELLIKTLIWLSATETGDRADLNLTPADVALWPRISAQAESCALAKCSQFRRGNCFVTRARRKAESAHVIVVNHALLLSDLASDGGILPEYSHLVVDEAHHLEEEATEQLGFTLSWGDLHSFLAGLSQVGAGSKPTGFLPDVAAALQSKLLSRETARKIQALISAAEGAAERSMESGHSFFEALQCFIHDHAGERPQYGIRFRITPSVRAQPGWSEIEVQWSEFSSRLLTLHRLLHHLEKELQELDDNQILDREGTVAELSGFGGYVEKLRVCGEEIISSPGANGIYWIEGATALLELAIRSAPLHVGEVLNKVLFSCKDTAVLTSATLTAEGSFDYVKERIGLEGPRELIVGSPFDYRRSTLLYVARDIPEPNRPAHQRAVESAILELAGALGGRTLVLFTSHAQLRMTGSTIRPRLEQQGILLLAHGVDGSRRSLLQAFKSHPRAVLMGTSSFWEGIDVVGEALSCLVIVKLPFAVPTDPIFAARSEGFDDPFRQYSVPQTILKLKQGFGRLIRSRSDRGVVVILDSRLGNRFYGSAFIHSLPPCSLRIGSALRVAEVATAWLSPEFVSADFKTASPSASATTGGRPPVSAR